MALFEEIPLTYKAYLMCKTAHEAVGQKRKYTELPYWVHPARVAEIVAPYDYTYDNHLVSAAWLHDVVEDTQVSLDLIRLECGDIVANLVRWLTDISKPEDGNREERKRIDRERWLDAPGKAKTIKLADLIDNTQSIVKFDPGFSKVYLREKALLMPFLTGGEQELWNFADKMIPNEYKE